MMQRRRPTSGFQALFGLVVAGALAVCGVRPHAANAGEYPGPDHDEQELWLEKEPAWYNETFRILRFRRAWTTSGCIGRPRTPRCAAETLLAAWLRRNVWLCDRVGWDPDFVPVSNPRQGAWGSRMLAYHTTYADRLAPADIPDEYRAAPHDWRAGDVAVRMNVYSCKGSRHCLATGEGSRTGEIRDCPPVRCAVGGPGALESDVQNPRITIARNVGDHWHVVDVVTGDGHFPDGLWPGRGDHD
jgi:hypothetical protein